MNLEQQYRTGWFPPVDPDHDWLLERVAEVEREDRPSYWREVLARAQALLAESLTTPTGMYEARALLRLDGKDPERSLVAHTEACVNADPAHEADYWAAMWLLRAPLAAQEEYRSMLPLVARIREQQQQCREAGWPEEWWGSFASIWLAGNGTIASARAWDALGWTPTDVLTAHIMVMGRYVPLRSRLTMLQPPARTDKGVELRPAQSQVTTSSSSRGNR